VAFVERYDKKAGIGTVIALMIPYIFVFLGLWIMLFMVWILLGITVVPSAPILLPPA
jgi:aminobenzoyl-glutamate transport protein